MSKKPVLTRIDNVQTSKVSLNDNYQTIEDHFEGFLSRDGSTPNQMEADLDLNSNDLLNVRRINAQEIVSNGSYVTGSVPVDSWPTRNAEYAEEAADLADGTLVELAGVKYEVDSTKTGDQSATNDLGVDGLKPFGVPTSDHFGADPTGQEDSLAALNALKAYDADVKVITPGDYDLSDTFFFEGVRKSWFVNGVSFNNTICELDTDMEIEGRLVIDPSLFGSRDPWFGVKAIKGQEGVRRDYVIRNVKGVGYSSGGTYRSQVTDAVINVDVTACGLVATHDHSPGGILGFSREDVTSTLPSISSGGSGYEDGTWIAPATGGSGSGAVFGLTVSSGVVTEAVCLFGGTGYSAGDTVSISTLDAVQSTDTDSKGMSGGSGLSITVGDVMDTATYFNSNKYTVSANNVGSAGSYGAVLTGGKVNYNNIWCYLEGIWTRDISPWKSLDTPASNTFNRLSILVNAGVGETTEAGTLLVDMAGAVGTTVCGGRSGNPYETTTDPTTLVDLGSDVVRLSLDIFSGSGNTRGDSAIENLVVNGTSHLEGSLNIVPDSVVTLTASGSSTGHTCEIDLSEPLTDNSTFLAGDLKVFGRRAAAGAAATKQGFFLSLNVVVLKASDGTYTVGVTDKGSINSSNFVASIASDVLTITFDTSNTMTTSSQWKSLFSAADFAGTKPYLW